MPNWCNNEVIITGKPKMLNKLLKQIATTASEAGILVFLETMVGNKLVAIALGKVVKS